MSKIRIPAGQVVIGFRNGIKDATPLTTNRASRFRFELLDATGQKFGDLDGVSGGSVEWNANVAVKGAGRISVSKANDVHKKQIRVSKNLPIVDEMDFEVDTEGFGFLSESDPANGPATSIVRSTSTFFEGGGALDITFAAPTSTLLYQNVVTAVPGLTVGQTYTFVASILNTAAANARLKIAGHSQYTTIPQKSDWQTVALTFVATSATVYFGIQNRSPQAGVHIYIDKVSLYEGTTTGYNGSTFEYVPFSWIHARVRPVLLIEGWPEQPLGVFVPSAPVEQWDEGGGRQEVELLDRTSILSQDYVPSTYTVKKGTNVISALKKIISSTGESPGSIADSPEVAKGDMVWGPGTNKLTIVNELLDAAGFFALRAGSNGQFFAEKYLAPKNRTLRYEMLDDHNSIYLPNLSIDRDIYDVPNRVIMTAQGDGESEAWTAVASNTNSKSPYSYSRRGRWITDVQLGVEATSLEVLQDKAKARLAQLSSNQTTIEITHAPLPGLRVNDVVRLRRKPAEVDTLFTVTKTSMTFDPTALAKTSLTQVVDL